MSKKNTIFGDKSGLKGFPGGLDFKGLRHKKDIKKSKFDFGPGNPKNRFLRFFLSFYEKKKNPEFLESRVRNPEILKSGNPEILK